MLYPDDCVGCFQSADDLSYPLNYVCIEYPLSVFVRDSAPAVR
jgi:hypothetical protein